MTKHTPTINTRLPLAALALALAAAAGSVTAAVATATSSSTVVTPIAISKATDLAFGSFAAGASAGSVTVSTSAARTFTGGVVLMGGTISAAKFDVTGQNGLNYSIVFGGTTQLTSGSDTMAFATVSDLSGAGAVSGNVSSGTLGASGQSIYVGGVLTVAANQPAGSYSGSVTATVVYE
ncbi:MAG: DUF4402 domain-containing protein [Telluria sp.]